VANPLILKARNMKVLNEDALLVCSHALGVIRNAPCQSLVTINKRRVLVERDPVSWTIVGCPNVGIAIKPCTSTLAVQVGYSDLIRIDGRRACLDSISGLTDGTPPGTVLYQVKHPGQLFVESRS
jgi:hypothetical protein